MRKTAYFCLCWTVLPSRSSKSFQKQYALKRSILVQKAIITGGDMALFDGLNKEHTVARPGFNRWLVPPAALAIHLCIGMAYGFSVFWLPLSKAIGIKESLACPANMSFLAEITATTCDWKISMLGWMFTLFFV